MEKIRDYILLRKAAWKRKQKNLAALYTKSYPNIKRYIASQIGSSTDAEDLAQNVFVQLHQSNDGHKIHQNDEAYLFGIARNIISQYYREKRNSIKTVPIAIESINEPSASYEIQQDQNSLKLLSSQQVKEILENAVEQLPPKTQEALRLRFLKGLSPRDAAKEAGCSANTFYQRLNAGIKAVKKLKNKNHATK